MGEPWTVAGDGLRLTVRLTPRGGRDAIDGIEALADGRFVLKVRVRAAPSDGEANAALTALLAREFDLPRSAVTLVAGATARLKTVALMSVPAALDERLRDRLASA
ncbi:hypothetical protein ASE63_15690 [Bosea sp. Root381]|uniref:DUF167 family protein n=1 Tax=Bosea sp. Root381 TaxID=1736524 RepID=UPI000701B8EE|nr:DUF167 family protein [Bosea sp. Root381]KRE15694.1 hypothetical protein ASE63_15690 [Bosea sp. Root381]